MVTDRLIYTNSAGKSIEFSVDSVFHTNIRTDVSGLIGVKTTIRKSQVVGVDGEIETGHHVESRDIDITGFIDNDYYRDNDASMRELAAVFSPFYTGILRIEGEQVYEIDVRPEEAPDPGRKAGARFPAFSISLIALNPNWRLSYEKTATIADSGTEVYYDGTKPCGIQIEITANADTVDMESFTIQHGEDTRTITFRTGGGVYLDTDDEMVLDTAPGQVNVTLNDTVALERLDMANSAFPLELYPGVNTVSWSAYGDEADFEVVIRYTPLYLGV
ncbi:MAG: phage tail domain-containing protein [Dehalococcoidia bacterium]|jgi:hypothetical protein